MWKYATSVLPNGQVFRWRNRDADYNRFKVVLTEQQLAFLEERQFTEDADDCHSDAFATIHRVLSQMP